jgi:hypothetical protein
MNNLSTKKIVNGIVKTLTVLTTVIVLFGLILAACLKIERVASRILPLYPRYGLALEGIKVFEGNPQVIKNENEIIKDEDTDREVMATLLDIDHPSWSVMLDFIKSEIAFLKSDRNQTIEETVSIEDQSDDNENATNKKTLTKINYDRIKTIFVVRARNVPTIGGKSITAPYSVQVIDPSQKRNRKVYEFLSFEEFKLDLKKMLVGELEFYSIVSAIIAVLCNIALYFIRKHFKAYLNKSLAKFSPY